MQTSRAPQRKGIKFLDAKVFIAALSVAVTAGLWNLFSINAVQAELQETGPEDAYPPETPMVETQDMPALPTLVPLVKVEPQPVDSPAVLALDNKPNNPPGLRSVTAPTQVVVQKVKPVFDQPQQVVDNGGRSGKSGRSATRTRSSR